MRFDAVVPMTVQAFGDTATRIAGHIAGDTAIVACEPAYAAEAMSAGVMLRRAGRHYCSSVHLDDARAVRVRESSLELCAAYETWDEVRLMLDDRTAKLGELRTTLDEAVRAALLEAIRLSDRVIARSWREAARIGEALGTMPREADVVIPPDPGVPPPVAFEAAPSDVLIYAPHDDGDALAVFLTALGDLDVPVTLVARTAPRIPGRIRFEPVARAAAALARARVIVDASTNDPGVALALARHGKPLAVASCGGAAECLLGVTTYEPWSRRSLLCAVADAFALGAPRERVRHWSEAPQPLAAPATFGPTPPLVSVIVTTFNRPQLLAETLASIERQTYPALEIIVVNDAGADVRAVAAMSPRAQLIDQPANGGPGAARNRGLRDASGTYAIFFDDDDEMFPDHIAALTAAILRSGLDVAYGQMINAFAIAAGPGRYVIDGLAGHDALLDHADIQWAGNLATTALLFRRDLPPDVLTVDEAMPVNEDYDFWLRLATGREWARVSEVTSMYYVRRDGSQRSAQSVQRYLDAHRAIYAKHPSERALVNAGRSSMMQLFTQTGQAH